MLHIDIETRSDADLAKLGVHRYAEDPSFSILLFAFAYDDGPIEVVDLAQGERIPESVALDLFSPDVIKAAFNAQFERVCLDRYFEKHTQPWHCSMIQANAMGLRGSLDTIGQALNLDQNVKKLETGKNLMRLFSFRRLPSSKNGYRSIFEPEDRPEEWQQFIEYCRQDVIAERAIFKKLESFPLSPIDSDLYALDQIINDRGVRIDIDLASSATEINAALYHHYEEDFLKITGIDTPTKLQRFKDWIKEKTGEEVTAITKGNLPTLQKHFKDFPDVVAALEIRELLSRTSVKKYEAMETLAGEGDRARGLFRFYGASTGRWSGRGIQPQNLPQNHLTDLDTARNIIRQRDLESLEMFYDDPADVLSQLIRTAIVPTEGCLFLVADFSAIEARVIAWLAGESWRLDVFNSHGKIYEASASQMFGVPIEQVTKGSELRQKGKVAELALGYQGGAGALRAMGALKMGLTEEELPGLVSRWRYTNQNIVRFWANTEEKAKDCILSGGPETIGPYLSFRWHKSILFIRLPSGRELAYPKAKLRAHQKFGGQIEITYQEIAGKGWAVKGTYGGKLVENIVQAAARDLLAVKMLDLHEMGYRIVMHVHDEVVIEVKNDQHAQAHLKEVLAVMSAPVDWAPGLTLNADGYLCEYYQKD